MSEIAKTNAPKQLVFDTDMVERAYDRWAPFYDLVFGSVFAKGRRAAIRAADRIGGRVLEVGVGTGISLPLYLSLIHMSAPASRCPCTAPPAASSASTSRPAC